MNSKYVGVAASAGFKPIIQFIQNKFNEWMVNDTELVIYHYV